MRSSSSVRFGSPVSVSLSASDSAARARLTRRSGEDGRDRVRRGERRQPGRRRSMPASPRRRPGRRVPPSARPAPRCPSLGWLSLDYGGCFMPLSSLRRPRRRGRRPQFPHRMALRSSDHHPFEGSPSLERGSGARAGSPTAGRNEALELSRTRPIAAVVLVALAAACFADVRALGRGARRRAGLRRARRRHGHRPRAADRAEPDHRAGARGCARRADSPRPVRRVDRRFSRRRRLLLHRGARSTRQASAWATSSSRRSSGRGSAPP